MGCVGGGTPGPPWLTTVNEPLQQFVAESQKAMDQVPADRPARSSTGRSVTVKVPFPSVTTVKAEPSEKVLIVSPRGPTSPAVRSCPGAKPTPRNVKVSNCVP